MIFVYRTRKCDICLQSKKNDISSAEFVNMIYFTE